MRAIVVSLVLLVCGKAAEDACFHKATNGSGKCLPLINCTYAFQGVLNQVDPQVCRLGWTAPIVCCPDNPPAATYLVNPTSISTKDDTCFHTETKRNGVCLPLIDCQYAYDGVLNQVLPQVCRLGQTSPIVCCPNNETTTTTTIRTALSNRISATKCRWYAGQVRRDQCPIKLRTTELRRVEASPEEFPHMASILYEERNLGDTSYLCFGSLISEQFVVCAAHCFSKPSLTPKEVHFGVVHLSVDKRPSVQSVQIREVIKHPKYKVSSVYNDIALVKLVKDVKFTKHVMPICLGDDANWETGAFAVAGFSDRRHLNRSKRRLEKAPIEVVDNAQCRKSYDFAALRGLIEEGISADTQICVTIKDGPAFISGCPLQMESPDADCMYTLIGFSCFGASNASYPNVFTRIQPYRTWIEEIVWPKYDPDAIIFAQD